MTRILTLEDFDDFDKQNQNNWTQNASFWLQHGHTHNALATCALSHIQRILKNREDLSFLDLGCGDGWLASPILASFRNSTYLGLDNNNTFVRTSTETFKNEERINFIQADFTKKEAIESGDVFDVVIACLSFIEVVDIRSALEYAKSKLAKGGIMVIISLNPINEINRCESSKVEFSKNVRFYQKYSGVKILAKKITVSGNTSSLDYFHVLYSVNDYLSYAFESGLELIDIDTVWLNPSRGNSPLFEVIVLGHD